MVLLDISGTTLHLVLHLCEESFIIAKILSIIYSFSLSSIFRMSLDKLIEDQKIIKIHEHFKTTTKFRLTKGIFEYVIISDFSGIKNIMRIIIQNCIEKTIGEGIKNEIEPDTLGCIVSCDLFYDDVCSPICEMFNNNTLDDILDRIIGKHIY